MDQKTRFNQEIKRRVERELGSVDRRQHGNLLDAAKKLLGQGFRSYTSAVTALTDWVMDNIPDVTGWLETSPLFKPGGGQMDNVIEEFRAAGPTRAERERATWDKTGYKVDGKGGSRSMMDESASAMDFNIEQIEAEQPNIERHDKKLYGDQKPTVEMGSDGLIVDGHAVNIDELSDADAVALARDISNTQISDPAQARKLVAENIDRLRRRQTERYRHLLD